MTTGIIVQARCGSTRFPGKVLADLCGKPVLEHVLSRCCQIGADHVILAVPKDANTDTLRGLAERLGGVGFYAGEHDENDVLARYVGAARAFNLDIIMRVTGDCPLIDPRLCKMVICEVELGADYACNFLPTRSFEKGLDCEAFTMDALLHADRNSKLPYEREHVTPWLWTNRNVSRSYVVSGDPSRAATNWCVDWPEDIKRLRGVLGCA